jgi:hypothetical protein
MVEEDEEEGSVSFASSSGSVKFSTSDDQTLALRINPNFEKNSPAFVPAMPKKHHRKGIPSRLFRVTTGEMPEVIEIFSMYLHPVAVTVTHDVHSQSLQ